MIAQAEHKDTIINRQGKTKDIMQAVVDCYNSDYAQVQELADNLPGNDTLSRCRAVFDFVDKNIKYQIDPLQKQWIRTPARLWSDGEGDCKSFSIFICSCLRCMGIPHLFRFAAYEGNGDPTHVYAVAIDESGKEIIVDPVYRDENGKAVFNKECPYTKKIDMKGTTEISRLSGPGIGYFTETEMIEIQGKEYLPRVEQDFLINLNALNTLYKGAVAAKDAAFANRIENLMDVATVAILLYEYSEDGFGDVEKGISCLRVMYDEGAFNQPVGTTNEQRSQVMNIMVSAIVQKSADVIANEEDIDYLLEATGISTPGFDASEFLGSDVAVGRASYRQMRAASLSGSKPTQAEINKIEQTLTTNAEYFMYSFIPDSRVSEFSHLPVVLEKRAYYKDFYNKLNKNNVLTQEQALSVVNSAIYSKYGYSGPIFLIMIRDGKIPVVGDILSIITVVAGLISAIGALLSKIFGKDEDEMNEELKVNGPSSTDGLFTVTDSNNSYPDNSTTDNPLVDFSQPTGTVASSNLLGILLVGGVLMALIFGGSGDKKKKKK
ncbi:transglutaminase-like domain-containing protein [Barnesiella intestinihominis]|uniref:transglutaminase-like domain-containing protein n=1 Tax=Barnesiella intestinihominis TaxID=487174 RepID=UPI00266FBDBD|nr:transglutaminase-like domain-containing protein [Barnesiella intestinihominis]